MFNIVPVGEQSLKFQVSDLQIKFWNTNPFVIEIFLSQLSGSKDMPEFPWFW